MAVYGNRLDPAERQQLTELRTLGRQLTKAERLRLKQLENKKIHLESAFNRLPRRGYPNASPDAEFTPEQLASIEKLQEQYPPESDNGVCVEDVVAVIESMTFEAIGYNHPDGRKTVRLKRVKED